MSKKIIACLILSLILITASYASGARSAAMGGAATALADDPYAVIDNPAGLGMMKTWGVSGTSGGILDSPNNGTLCWTMPTEYGTVGVAISDSVTPTNLLPEVRIGLEDLQPINIATRSIVISYGYEMNNAIQVKETMGRLAVGFNVKSTSALDYTSKGLYTGPSFSDTSADLGFLYRLNPIWSAGVTASNVIHNSTSVEPGYDAGIACNIKDILTISQNISSTGVELHVGSTALRAGYKDGAASFGAGIILSGVKLDYAYASSSHYVSFGFVPPTL